MAASVVTATTVPSWVSVQATGCAADPETDTQAPSCQPTFGSALGPLSKPEEVYVGEASILSRRFQNYRTPGPTQHTNIRMNALFAACLGRDETITVDVISRVRDGADSSLAPDRCCQ